MNARKLNKITVLISGLILLSMVLAACAPAAAPAAPAPTQPPAPVATTAPTAVPNTGGTEATINVATDPKLGKILVDGKGMTFYMFGKDTADKSNCNAGCLAAWPPLKTLGHPTLGDGVDASLVGSAPLADGSMIVTYNHMPLYYYVKDTKAGDTTGQGVGDVWFVVAPDGNKVMGNPPAGGQGTPAAPTAPAAAPAALGINVATDATLGKILVDSKGMTLYMYAKDTPDTSTCTGNCLKNWPPLLANGQPKLGDGVDASLIGTAALADGSKIITYNHMPLYYYIKDTQPGDKNGQGVGSVWFVVSPDGKAVGMGQ